MPLPRLSRVAPALVCLLSIFMLSGCAPSGRAGSRGEVVEIETIEALDPTKDQARVAARTPAIDEEAAKAKLTVDAATAAADRAIAEAGKTIDAASTTAAEKPAAEAAPVKPAAADTTLRERVLLGEPSLTAGVPGTGPITLEQIDRWLADPKNSVELEPVLPLGLSQGAKQVTGLDKNPLTRAKIELGRQLYFDPRLSADSTVSCASCHNPAEGYSAHTQTGVGIRGQLGGRNSPVSFNRILSGPQFWDGRADSLEAQAVGPIANPIEMGFTHEGVVKRLGEMPVY
ncbi:MAG: cytochrome-c peroxidase, partial [Planctomycetia bacterium]